jgi:HEAT repeat protein
MNIDQVIQDLESSSKCNETLQLIAQIIVDTDARLIQRLTDLITTPEKIEDTNRFASILEDLSQPEFIPSLIEAIKNGNPSETIWLADYMYVLGNLLAEQDDWWEPEEEFVHLLGDWLFSTGGGEISWKAGIILAELEHPATLEYFLRGAEDQELLHLTRVCCIGGIMHHFRDQAPSLLQKLADDPKPEVREAVVNALEFLKSKA